MNNSQVARNLGEISPIITEADGQQFVIDSNEHKVDGATDDVLAI